MVRIISLIALTGLLGACSQAPAEAPQADTQVDVSVAEIIAAPTLEGAHPAIRQFDDQGNPNKQLVRDPNNGVRRVMVNIECPAEAIVTCGAEAAQAAAIWLAKHGPEWGVYKGEAVTDLLVNVDPVGAYGGYQLIGAMPAASVLERADKATILTTFRWNSAGENGEIAVANWCGKSSQKNQTPEFCDAFFKDECSFMKTDPVVKACPRELLQR